MKKTVRSIAIIIVSAVMLLSTFLCPVYAAEDDNYLQSGKMDLDVMFVLDASGSMLTSDPNKVALDAMNLFVDLTDESCGAGYVVYTEKIKAYSDIVSFSDPAKKADFKKELAGLNYDPNGDTDISLGLTKALNTFQEKGDANGRKRAIILLSDGNTHLLNGPRTVEDSKKEMEETLLALSRQEIPVFAIGLNYDGTLDKREIERITTATSGKSFSTKSSDELPTILSDIFSEIYQLKGKELTIVNGMVRITIENSSVFYVNIIIKSKCTLEQLNPRLTNPKKEEVPIEGNDNIKVTSAGTYTLIKLIYPMTGDWKLYLDNVTEENCKITQIDFYSVYVKQILEEKAGVNTPYTIAASLNEGTDAITDPALLKTITMTAVISTDKGEDQVLLSIGENGIFSGKYTPTELGDFVVYTKAVAKTFEKESKAAKVTVVDYIGGEESMEMSGSEEDENALGFAMTIITYIGIGILVLVIIIVVIFVVIGVIRSKKQKDTIEPEKPTPPPPPPAPAPKPKPVYVPEPPAPPPPEAKPPEYVDVPLLEHAPLEELIKRGSDNTFTKSADDFETDHDLEKLVKKGTDDAFKMNPDSYAVDPSLAALIRTGGDGLEAKGIQKEEPPEEPEE